MEISLTHGWGRLVSLENCTFIEVGRLIKQKRKNLSFNIFELSKYLFEISMAKTIKRCRYPSENLKIGAWNTSLTRIEKSYSRLLNDFQIYKPEYQERLSDYLATLGINTVSQISGLENFVSEDFRINPRIPIFNKNV